MAAAMPQVEYERVCIGANAWRAEQSDGAVNCVLARHAVRVLKSRWHVPTLA
jgi:hypothetical protein